MFKVCQAKLRLNSRRYSIILISNQALKQQHLDGWKKKIPLISAAVSPAVSFPNPFPHRREQLPDVPFRILAASAKDGFRKPMPGMWNELERIFAEDGVRIGEWHRNSGMHCENLMRVTFR